MGRRGHTTTAMRRGSGVRRFLRRLLKIVAVLAIIGGTVYAVGEWYKGRDYLPHFIERKGELVRADENLIVELYSK